MTGISADLLLTLFSSHYLDRKYTVYQFSYWSDECFTCIILSFLCCFPEMMLGLKIYSVPIGLLCNLFIFQIRDDAMVFVFRVFGIKVMHKAYCAFQYNNHFRK